ncbi:hypothetical protein ACLBXM_19725 [Xanthobacteraceae bacterium A53D]
MLAGLLASVPARAELSRISAGTMASDKATVEDLAKAEQAVLDVWSRLPYQVRNVMFVSRKAESFGDFQKRPDAVFKRGEKLLTYLEPVGFGWKGIGEGHYEFGVVTDFEIINAKGRILGGQKAFQTVILKSHARNREFYVSLTMNISGAKPGDYVLAYTLHDVVNGGSARVEQPFTIADDDE